MVPTGTSQVFEQIFRVSPMVGLAYYFIDRGLHLAAGGATSAIPRCISWIDCIDLLLLSSASCADANVGTAESKCYW